MNIHRELENFTAPFIKAHCPKCKRKVKAKILSEFSSHFELYHDIAKCQKIWQYSTNEQCHRIRKKNEQSILKKLNQKTGRDRKSHKISAIIFYGIITVITFGKAALVLSKYGVDLLNSDIAKEEIKKNKVKAKKLSYDIKSYFKHLKKHSIAPKFKKKAKSTLKKIPRKKTKNHSPWLLRNSELRNI